ncbi:MAG: prepilin-type N-terminal cleavage/methylation domain-containing protein [Desulfuromonas sp.]|nr:prepilin-type N-terminal cleavage/methylation domain-containing protein [Desulfuromonas sp.]
MATMNSNRWHNRRGFTLLEVMIALAVIGIALVTCLGLANSCVRSHAEIQRITTATMLAQNKMAELETAASNNNIDSIELTGTWDQPYSQYSWQVVFSDTPVTGVQQVNVAILWGEQKNNESVSIDSFLFN